MVDVVFVVMCSCCDQDVHGEIGGCLVEFCREQGDARWWLCGCFVVMIML